MRHAADTRRPTSMARDAVGAFSVEKKMRFSRHGRLTLPAGACYIYNMNAAAKPRISLRSNGQHQVSYAGREAILMDDPTYPGFRQVTVIDEHGIGTGVATGGDDALAVAVWVRGIDGELELEAAKARRPGKTSELTIDGFAVTVVHNASIRIVGERYGKHYDQTFTMGSTAEYGSYNLSYMGEILSITPKTVTIREGHGRTRKHRLKIVNFVSRNYDGNGPKHRQNADWYD